MTQTTTTANSTAYQPGPTPVRISTLTDNAILVGVWSVAMAADDTSIFAATPAAGGTIRIQVSKDSGTTWADVAAQPFSRTFVGEVPPGTTLVRATATVGTATLAVSTPDVTNYAAVSTVGMFAGSGEIGLFEVTPYVNMTATGTAFTGACELAGYDCTTAAGNITIYDNTSAAGVIVVPTTALALGRIEFTYKRALGTGCYVVLSGAATVNVLVG